MIIAVSQRERHFLIYTPPMEKTRLIPCAANLMPVCEAPGGPKVDRHHETPRRFLGMAKLEDRPKEYCAALYKVVTHPMNKVEVCWCIHHKYGLEALVETQLPSQAELDGKLERWDG